jgi:hypothetical protein
MDQTPAHERHHADLLRFMPIDSPTVVKVGGSFEALAREHKKIPPDCRYCFVNVSRGGSV